MVPAARPAAAPGERERSEAHRALVVPRGVAVDQERRCAQEESDASDVVERLAGLEVDHRLGAQDDRGPQERLGPQAIRAAHGPAREEAEAQEAKVEERRDEIAREREDRDRVQDLRVRRVERREEDRVEEEGLARRAGLDEPGGERHVVPERIGAAHAPGDAAERRDRPSGEDRGDDDRHDHQPQAVRGRRGRRIAPALGAWHRGRWRPPRFAATATDADQVPELRECAEGAEELGKHGRERDGRHGLCDQRGWAGEAGEREAPEAHRGEAEGKDDQSELGGAQEVLAGAERAVSGHSRIRFSRAVRRA